MKVLLQFRHGLGDAVACQILIRHLKHYHPKWFIGVETRRGHESALQGHADRVYIAEHPFYWRTEYDKIFHMPWERPGDEDWWSGHPSTKPPVCFENYFPEITPIEELFFYEIFPG